MNVEITLKNYRCFPDESPATFTVRTGMTAFVGVNNSGKSALLRFFYEFRDLFASLSELSSLRNGIRSNINFGLTGIQDLREVFTRSNPRPMQISFVFSYDEESETTRPKVLNVMVPYESNVAHVEIETEDGERVGNPTDVGATETHLILPDRSSVEVGETLEILKALSRTRYIGAFRNAINVGENADYYDMKTGQSFIREWDARQMGGSSEQNEAIHRLTRDVRRIFELDELVVSASEDQKTLKLIINGESRNWRKWASASRNSSWFSVASRLKSPHSFSSMNLS